MGADSVGKAEHRALLLGLDPQAVRRDGEDAGARLLLDDPGPDGGDASAGASNTGAVSSARAGPKPDGAISQLLGLSAVRSAAKSVKGASSAMASSCLGVAPQAANASTASATIHPL